MFRIKYGSEAWHRLLLAMQPDNMGRDISIHDRTSHPDYPGVAIKIGEDMWSPTLKVTNDSR